MNIDRLKQGFAAVGDLAYEPLAPWATSDVAAVEKKLGFALPPALVALVSGGLPRGFSQPSYDSAFKFLSVCAGFSRPGDMLEDGVASSDWGAVPFANAGAQAVYCLKVTDAPIELNGETIEIEGLKPGAVFAMPAEMGMTFHLASPDLDSFVEGLAATLEFYAERRAEFAEAADGDDPDEDMKPLVEELAAKVGQSAPDFVQSWVAIHYPLAASDRN